MALQLTKRYWLEWTSGQGDEAADAAALGMKTSRSELQNPGFCNPVADADARQRVGWPLHYDFLKSRGSAPPTLREIRAEPHYRVAKADPASS